VKLLVAHFSPFFCRFILCGFHNSAEFLQQPKNFDREVRSFIMSLITSSLLFDTPGSDIMFRALCDETISGVGIEFHAPGRK
jgi:hypothetical protein